MSKLKPVSTEMSLSTLTSTTTLPAFKPKNFVRLGSSTPVSLAVLIIGVTIAVSLIVLSLTALFVRYRRKRRPFPVTPSELPLSIIPSHPDSGISSHPVPNFVDVPSTGACPLQPGPLQPIPSQARTPTPMYAPVLLSPDPNREDGLLTTAAANPPLMPHVEPSYRAGSFDVPPSVTSTVVAAQSNRNSYANTSTRTVVGSIADGDRRQEKLARAMARRLTGRRRRRISLSEFPIPNPYLDIFIPTTDTSH